METVSVVVPIYMIDKYLGICIESIIKQTYTNLEIILVDDGSKDRCGELCDLYAKKDKRIKVIHKPNGGLVSARKVGLQQSNGKYISFVDGDDWIEPGFIEALYTESSLYDADVVCAGYSRDLFSKAESFLNTCPLGLYEGESLFIFWSDMISARDYYRPGISTYLWNKLFRRDILLEPQSSVDSRISIGEDAAVTYPALLKSKRVVVTANTDYHYRQREDSMLKQSAPFSDEAQKLKYLYDFMKYWASNTNPDLHILDQVEDYILANVIMRSGGFLPNDDFSIFDEKYYGKRVVIYNAGTFGQQLIKRFKASGHCEVVGWVDDDFWEYRRCCLDVDPIEKVRELVFDYILIAKVDEIVIEGIKKRFVELGVPLERILTVTIPRNKQETIKRFLDVEAIKAEEAKRKRGNNSHA